MQPVLWQIEISHYNEKVRWALDYKGIEHVRRTPIPGLHGFRALALTRGASRRLPVLSLEGRNIGDSTAIIAALENYCPELPLYPDDPAHRVRALELEEFFDESLAPEVRRFIWHHTLPDAEAIRLAIIPNAGAARTRLLRAMGPVAAFAVRKDFDVSEASAATALRDIRAAMDRLESEIQPSGYLVGDRFSVADLTAAALFTPLLAPPGRQYLPPSLPEAVLEVRAELAARQGGAWVSETFSRHRGASAEVPA